MSALRHLLISFLLLTGAQLAAYDTVVIDPGHGGADEGTSWFRLNEKTMTLAVAKHLENILRDRGVPTVMTRRYDRYISLDERARTANRIPNSLLISIHFNASREHDISGFETYHFFASPSGRCIAESIQESLNRRTPGRARSVKPQDYAVLSRTYGLAILVECGFLSNKAESERLSTEEGQQALAEALAEGLLRVKPVVDCDPPTTALARWALNSRKLDEEARKLAAAAERSAPHTASSDTPKKKSTIKGKKKSHNPDA